MSIDIVGSVEAVCMSPDHGFPTHPQDMVTIGINGIEGDAHSGIMREIFRSPGVLKPNDRPISIVADEVRRKVNERLGIKMRAGDFNEQVLVSGLGDLGDVAIGDLVRFDTGVLLEVVDQAYPCAKLEAHNGNAKLIKALLTKDEEGNVHNKRGILTKVITPGTLCAGVGVLILPKPAL